LSAQALIKEAAEYGVRVSLNGDSVALKAATKPSADLLAKLQKHKPEIVALLRQEARPYDILADQVRFDRELAALRLVNAKIYANPTPWKVKP
jgi:hypothetical protein